MEYTKITSIFNFFVCIMCTHFIFPSELHTQHSQLIDHSPSKALEYDYLVIVGCQALNMSKRIKYAMDLTNNGLNFNHLVFLTSQRTLTNEEAPMIQEIFTTILPHNGISLHQKFANHEASLLKFLLNHTYLPIKWHEIKKMIVESPMWQLKEDTWVEAQPSHAIEEWLKREPKPGSILAVGDQDTILKDNLPSSFSIETIIVPSSQRNQSQNPKKTRKISI